MKKIIYLLLISFSFTLTSYAFDIDINKIDINSKSNEVINSLNKTYNIEVKDFSKQIINDEKVTNYAKELTKETLSNKSFDELYDTFNKKYLYINSDNGVDTLTGTIFIKMFLQSVKDKKIEANYIKDIRTVSFNENDALSFVYLKDTLVDGKIQDLIFGFWLKEENNEYKLFFPWLTYDDDLQDYFNKVSLKEEDGNIIGGTFNKISLSDDTKLQTVDDSLLNELYQKTKYSNVSVTGMDENGVNIYGSGFVIREGIVATTWSNFLKILNDSNYMYVTDVDGLSYKVSGVVAAEANYDVVLLKLENEALQKVDLGDTSQIKTNDNLFMVNSKSSKNFSISYGTFISQDKGRIKNLFSLSSSDVGSALYNADGQVIGFTVADLLNEDLSYANSTEYLKEIQNILVQHSFDEIVATSLDDFKNNYYRDHEEEIKYDNTGKAASEYKKVGNVLSNIDLPLIKASFKDKILSLRYKNETDEMLDSLYLVSNYTKILEKDGYTKTYDKNNKQIYIGKKYKVIIKNDLNYLIILIMEK